MEQKHYHIKHMKTDYRKKINNFSLIRKVKVYMVIYA
jgi:hypothetical protein